MQIYDTTLRDGTQSKDVNLTVQDKLSVLEMLDYAGIDYIELGWPGSNPKDMEVFLKASEFSLKHTKIAAFCSTRRKDLKPDKDPNLLAVIASKATSASIFGKTWLNHIEKQLRITPEENLEIIGSSVRFLKKHGLEVFYDAEHFFDGYKENRNYAVQCIDAAFKSGADAVILCDTNGGCLPGEIQSIITDVTLRFPAKRFGIHCHNDSGCAVANSLVSANFLSQIQGTINGFGERAGNADLCQIIPALHLKMNIKTNFQLSKLSEISEKLYVLANIKENPSQPYVGKNAFTHKAGMHVDAISKGAVYEHIKPELVGNSRDIVLSDLSGSANVMEVLSGYGLKVEKNDPRVREMLNEIKELEKRGYGLADIEAEKFLLFNKHFAKKKTFDIIDWRISSEVRNDKEFSECILRGKIDDETFDVIASVDEKGPVDSAYVAMKKLVSHKYKQINYVLLVNYKVMIAEEKAAESSVRVYIEFHDTNNDFDFAAIGVSANILEASIEAISKGFKYYLLKKVLY